MAQALLVVRIGLALVFVLAALGKLTARSSPRRLLETFELGAWAGPAVAVLPVAELAIAAGLLVTVAARPAAVVATAVLVTFSLLITRNVLSGRGGSCNCFGSLASSLPSRHPLARNLLLAAAAVLVTLAGPGTSLADLARTATGQAEVLVVAGAAIGAVVVRRRRRRRTVTMAGRPAALSAVELAAGSERTIVAFLEPRCAPCRSVLPAIARFDGGARHERLVVVTSTSSELDGEFAAAVAGRHVRDDGQLAARFNLPATPAAAVLGPRGSLDGVAIGASEVEQLLAGEAGATTSRVRDIDGRVAISRRRLVAAGMLAAALPGFDRPLLRSRLRALGAPSGVTCPSCGSCVICTASSSSSKVTCGPCSQHCSGAKLCTSYANEFPPFTTLAAYLRSKGFSQDGDPLTHGLIKDGELYVMSGATAFTSRSPTTPRALLVYNLTNSGQTAWAALTNAKGLVTSVVSIAGSEVVSVPVSPPPASTTAGAHVDAGSAGSEERAQAASPYSCADVCSFALGLAATVLTLPASVLAFPEMAALGFAGALFAGGVGLGNTNAGITLSTLVGIVTGSSLVDGLLAGVVSAGDAYGQVRLCEDYLCKLKLQYCCTSNGACYDSDGECEHECPGGLAHPMAHCNAYLNGKLVSKLISP